MNLLVWTANIAGWPVLHFSIAWAVHKLPRRFFAQDGLLFRAWSWEDNGRFYQRWLAIRRWKSALPDGAPWVGGFAKKRLASRDAAYLHEFMLETRRAEFAHWCMFACLPVFFLWNPLWACAVMAIYATLANLPCIAVQRYNRLALRRLADRAHTAPALGEVRVAPPRSPHADLV